MRRDLIIGILVSLIINGGAAFLGQEMRSGPPKPPPRDTGPTIQVMEMPKIEPDEPPPDEVQEQQPLADLAPPELTDVPQVVTDTSFVQPIQPPPPDSMQINKNALTIPANVGNWGMGVKIFDASQLDQQPQATLQGRPTYPFEMRRAGISGQVLVDFIVDVEGNVHNAYAFSSSQREFESAAVQAVSKWRFRPGKKSGRAVNTHMQVSIVFTLNNDEN